jgi:hypothetical protein
MEAYSMRLKISFIVSLIAFSIVIMVTLMYQNSSFGLFEGFSKGMAIGGMAHKNVTAGGLNVTTNNQFGLRSNVTLDNFGGREKGDVKIKSK